MRVLSFLAGAMVSVFLATACSHSRSIESGRAEEKQASSDKGEHDSTPSHDKPKKKPTDGREAEQKQEPSSQPSAKKSGGAPAPPLSMSPEGLLRPGAMENIQQRLIDKRYLEAAAKSGRLDSKTEAAIRRFQRDNDLPATGTPDDETVHRLGLKATDVFRSAGGQRD